jgi:hypothetical protein
MSFTHPLAKKAKIWPMKSQDGSERRVLVVITTLTLDPESKNYKKNLVQRLSDAVSLYLEANGGVADFILLNRMREWDA